MMKVAHIIRAFFILSLIVKSRIVLMWFSEKYMKAALHWVFYYFEYSYQ